MAVRAPQGFCAAPEGRATLDGQSFVAFTPCAASAPAVVLTATVGPAGSAEGLDLSGRAVAGVLTTPAGRALLSRSGRAATVRVHEVIVAEGAVLVRLTDTAPAPAPMAPGEGWRAVLQVAGRLVTLSVAGTEAAPLDRGAGRALIGRFVRAIRAANLGA